MNFNIYQLLRPHFFITVHYYVGINKIRTKKQYFNKIHTSNLLYKGGNNATVIQFRKE